MMLLSIKKRAEFLEIGKDNTRFYSHTILLLAQKTPQKYLINPATGKTDSFCRVGYTVTKKAGKAVIRNKIKRRYREAFRLLYKEYAQNHFDYIILCRREAPQADFKKLYNDLKFCFKGINRLLKTQNDAKENQENHN